MFTIKSYLQYKNTPDGKPRVLKLPKEYQFFIKKTDVTPKNILTYQPIIIEKEYLTFFDTDYCEQIEVLLEDCKPLLTVEIDGVECTEGDIITEQFCKKGCFETYMFSFKNGKIEQEKFDYKFDFDFCTFDSVEKQEKQYKKIVSIFGKIKPEKNVVASFFDDPKKWSKLLWNCTESEGWGKIFNILNIKN